MDEAAAKPELLPHASRKIPRSGQPAMDTKANGDLIMAMNATLNGRSPRSRLGLRPSRR